jgi:hypothetical protein
MVRLWYKYKQGILSKGAREALAAPVSGGKGVPGCLALRIDAFDPHSLTDKSRIPVNKQKHTHL